MVFVRLHTSRCIVCYKSEENEKKVYCCKIELSLLYIYFLSEIITQNFIFVPKKLTKKIAKLKSH